MFPTLQENRKAVPSCTYAILYVKGERHLWRREKTTHGGCRVNIRATGNERFREFNMTSINSH
jgi:hypothetical protein